MPLRTGHFFPLGTADRPDDSLCVAAVYSESVMSYTRLRPTNVCTARFMASREDNAPNGVRSVNAMSSRTIKLVCGGGEGMELVLD